MGAAAGGAGRGKGTAKGGPVTTKDGLGVHPRRSRARSGGSGTRGTSGGGDGDGVTAHPRKAEKDSALSDCV